MSLIIDQSPNRLFSPVYNEMVYVVHESSSATLTQPNFKYICQIYDGSNTINIATIKRIPLPDGYGVFDIHRILETLITYDISINDSGGGFLQCLKMQAQWIIRFGEEYGSPPVPHLGLTNDENLNVAWNGIFDMPEFITNSGSQILNINSTQQFLTNQRTQSDFSLIPRKVHSNERAWLYFADIHVIGMGYNNIGYAQFVVTDKSGGINTYTLPYSSFGVQAFVRLPCGPYDMTVYGFVDPTTVDYYTIQLLNTSAVAMSEKMTFQVVCYDPKYDNYRLHFLNKLGGFDSFNFNKISHQTAEMQKQMYKQVLGSESTGAWSYNFYDRLNTQFDTQFTTKYKVQSDWITDDESIWLQELLTSPVVILDSEVFDFTPITIETTSWEVKRKQNTNEKVFNITVDISLSYTQYRQRG